MKYGPKMRSGDLSKLKNDLRRQENDLRRLPPSLKWLPKSPDIRTSISQNMHQCKGAGSRVSGRSGRTVSEFGEVVSGMWVGEVSTTK